MQRLLAALMNNPWTRGMVALFILFEAFNLAVIPGWQGTLQLSEFTAELEKETQIAVNAAAAQTAAANNIKAQAQEKLGQARAAMLLEKSKAEKAEQEAITAASKSGPSPEREKFLAEKTMAEAKKLLGTASSARLQAKNDADAWEQQAQKMKADADYEQQSAAQQIGALREHYITRSKALRDLLGGPLPDLLSR